MISRERQVLQETVMPIMAFLEKMDHYGAIDKRISQLFREMGELCDNQTSILFEISSLMNVVSKKLQELDEILKYKEGSEK